MSFCPDILLSHGTDLFLNLSTVYLPPQQTIVSKMRKSTNLRHGYHASTWGIIRKSTTSTKKYQTIPNFGDFSETLPEISWNLPEISQVPQAPAQPWAPWQHQRQPRGHRADARARRGARRRGRGGASAVGGDVSLEGSNEKRSLIMFCPDLIYIYIYDMIYIYIYMIYVIYVYIYIHIWYMCIYIYTWYMCIYIYMYMIYI